MMSIPMFAVGYGERVSTRVHHLLSAPHGLVALALLLPR
jgi:hypothetical protein